MKTKVKKIWDFIFKNDPDFKKKTLHIVRKSVNVDAKIQKILINYFLSNEK